MNDITRISKAIGSKKDLEANLPLYSNRMMHLYNQFAMIKFSMNYYTVSEVFKENDYTGTYLDEVYSRINDVVKSGILELDASKCDSLAKDTSTIRDDIIRHMEVVTSYVDKFQIFEYVLNRVEYRFDLSEFDDSYYMNSFTNDIMHYIIADKETVNAKISEIIAQLPVRITKAKFYERISDAFSLYKGGQKNSLDEFVYMLRTVSMLYEPEGFKTDYDDLYAIYSDLSAIDYKNITEEEYKLAADKLQVATEKISKISDMYVMLEELVNDLLIIVLTSVYNMESDSRLASLPEVIREVRAYSVGESEEIDLDFVTEVFTGIEGVQEDLYSRISSNDFVIDDYCGEDILKSIMLDKQFAVLKMASKLSSSSIFIKLTDEDANEEVTEQYIEETFRNLTMEFDKLFDGVSLIVKRAVMSNVLGVLPNFFKNIDELQMYINVSLLQCNDTAERRACVKLIREIINDVM